MAEIVYVLCAVTSVVVAVLLWRGWRSSRARLLLWTAICFMAFSLNNLLLLLDETLLRDSWDLRWARHGSGLAGALVLLGGLIWDSREAP